MKFGVVVFPGSNCDHDAFYAVQNALGQQAAFLWHQSTDLEGSDVVILPGGFSYGDYLRTGAIARFAPVMTAVRDFAARGGLVLGICNGFQVLTEAGLLPGALMRNAGLKYICRDIYLRVERQDTPYTARIKQGTVLKIPIGHGEGCYFAPEEVLKELEEKRQVVFRYCDENGQVTAGSNPNGSLRAIAGVCNARGNVLGLMPHPDRCAEEALGNAQGRRIFDSIVHAWDQARRQRI